MWQRAIQDFDADLKIRMTIITRHEITGVDLDSQSFTRKALGFPVPGQFPCWRDHTKEWRNRNRERVNIVARKQQKNWRLKNLEKARARDRRYYYEAKRKSLTKVLELVS
jgi:hypothetical protein